MPQVDTERSSHWSNLLSAASSYFIWGLFPLYWKLFQGIDATELIAHRIAWALLLLLGVVAAQRRLGEFFGGLAEPRNLASNILSGVLLSINWLVYVWAVNAGFVIECSLGYFLVPLINVLLGRFVLHERLHRPQTIAIVLATAGVAMMVWIVGRPPWIALAVAGTFGGYGLLRKRSKFGPLLGLAAETLLLAPIALIFLVYRYSHHTSALNDPEASRVLLIASTGLVTAVPLLLFAKGARGLRFITLGLLQYIAPTCQFLLGWLAYGEPLSAARTWAFAVIWLGLIVYSVDAILRQRASAKAAAATGAA